MQAGQGGARGGGAAAAAATSGSPQGRAQLAAAQGKASNAPHDIAEGRQRVIQGRGLGRGSGAGVPGSPQCHGRGPDTSSTLGHAVERGNGSRGAAPTRQPIAPHGRRMQGASRGQQAQPGASVTAPLVSNVLRRNLVCAEP